jgi:hypothetical protein
VLVLGLVLQANPLFHFTVSFGVLMCRSIEKVRQSVIDSYNTTAESLIARCGAVSALAAAIAIISGNDKSRSLITAAPVRNKLAFFLLSYYAVRISFFCLYVQSSDTEILFKSSLIHCSARCS